MSFIKKVKAELQNINLDNRLTYEQHCNNFKTEVSAHIAVYLQQVEKYLRDLDEDFETFFKQSVAEQDAFSAAFEKNIKDNIVLWIAVDDAHRNRYNKIIKTYQKKLKSVDMLHVVEQELAKIHKDIEKHVTTANTYGIKWTTQIDNAGIQVKNKIIKNTINWFKQLTVEDLLKSYKVGLK